MKLPQLVAKAIVILASSAALSVFAQQAAPVRNIDVQQGRTMQQGGAFLLDVREPDEFASGHAPGSMLIPLGQLKNRIGEIRAAKSDPVVVICRSGRRSLQAADMLGQLGFTSVYNVQGGMIAWEKAALPVSKVNR